MRSLSVAEIGFVSGGDIIELPPVDVVASRLRNGWVRLSGSAVEKLKAALELNFSCMNPDSVERFVEHTYTPPLSTEEIEKKLTDALAQTDEQLRDQAILGLALAAMGGAAMAFAPAVVIAGVLGLIAKGGIALAGAVLAAGGTWMFTDAMDELDNGG